MAPAVALMVLLGASPAAADPGTDVAGPGGPAGPSPPFVDHTQWAQWGSQQGGSQWGHLRSLRVYPTPNGRAAARQVGTGAVDEAWTEVLALSPDADTAGMRAQFICHWQFAEFARPGKTSWNLEPWRPVVSDSEMFASGCNPGGPEEAF